MHIHEAVLSGSPQGIAVLCAGAVAAAGGTAIGLRRLDYEQVPRVALVTAAFFVVSLIHVPLGVASVHLVLNGLVGLMLGWISFPALLVALLLQAVLFGHGGLLALGLNTAHMALPAVLCYYLFHRFANARSPGLAFAAGFGAGSFAVLLSVLLTAASLWIAGQEFALLVRAVILLHLAIAVVEGLVTGSAVVALNRLGGGVSAAPSSGTDG